MERKKGNKKRLPQQIIDVVGVKKARRFLDGLNNLYSLAVINNSLQCD